MLKVFWFTIYIFLWILIMIWQISPLRPHIFNKKCLAFFMGQIRLSHLSDLRTESFITSLFFPVFPLLHYYNIFPKPFIVSFIVIHSGHSVYNLCEPKTKAWYFCREGFLCISNPKTTSNFSITLKQHEFPLDSS